MRIEKFKLINILSYYRWIYYNNYNNKSNEYYYNNNINNRQFYYNYLNNLNHDSLNNNFVHYYKLLKFDKIIVNNFRY